MRDIEWTRQFKRDYKREAKGPHRDGLDTLFAVIETIANDQALELKHRDHGLIGNWQGFRECHVKPDLLLIYEKPDETILRLVRLGSHSELKL